ncbi:MAG: hypothetical protein ICV70_06265 [Jiangellaceae bacterium]|nr:hypothetical protein [Jiangellaceae bacterium]
MARRRRGHRIPWGVRPAEPDEFIEFFEERPPDEPPGHPPPAGGAGVREPRRPRPNPPGLSATAEPEPETFLDVTPTS